MNAERIQALLKAAERDKFCWYLEDSGWFCNSHHHGSVKDYGHQFVSLASLLREVAGMDPPAVQEIKRLRDFPGNCAEANALLDKALEAQLDAEHRKEETE